MKGPIFPLAPDLDPSPPLFPTPHPTSSPPTSPLTSPLPSPLTTTPPLTLGAESICFGAIIPCTSRFCCVRLYATLGG